jgi:hypothetical protein
MTAVDRAMSPKVVSAISEASADRCDTPSTMASDGRRLSDQRHARWRGGVTLPAGGVCMAKKQSAKRVAKKTAKRAAKKSAKKAAKRTAKKSVKKAARKPAAKKTAKKSAKTATRKTARKSARKTAAKRELIDTGTDQRFVRRAPGGTFNESDDVGRSLAADRRTKAATKTTSGQGDKGDR